METLTSHVTVHGCHGDSYCDSSPNPSSLAKKSFSLSPGVQYWGKGNGDINRGRKEGKVRRGKWRIGWEEGREVEGGKRRVGGRERKVEGGREGWEEGREEREEKAVRKEKRKTTSASFSNLHFSFSNLHFHIFVSELFH